MMAFFTVRIARGLQTHLDFSVLLYDNAKTPKQIFFQVLLKVMDVEELVTNLGKITNPNPTKFSDSTFFTISEVLTER